ncbi:9981_t:CDS:2, partial [Entrophospora sp. SA101]
MLCALPKMRFCVSELTESETELIDKLLKSEDVDDIPTVTDEEKTIRKLFSRIKRPKQRVRIGFKVDAIFEYQNLSSTPVIGCLEVSGGLPRCSRSKEWGDTLKLGLELRDLWVIAGDHLTGVDISELVLWGLIVVGRKIRVYAFASSGFLFHLILMYEALLPSSREDLYNLQLAYLVLKEYKKKLDETKNMLIEL